MNNDQQLLKLLKKDLMDSKDKLDVAYKYKTYETISQHYHVYEYLRNRIQNYEMFLETHFNSNN